MVINNSNNNKIKVKVKAKMLFKNFKFMVKNPHINNLLIKINKMMVFPFNFKN